MLLHPHHPEHIPQSATSAVIPFQQRSLQYACNWLPCWIGASERL